MRKTIGTILAVAFVLIGIHFGIISGLIGAAIAAYSLKHFGVVSPNSAWVYLKLVGCERQNIYYLLLF